MRCVTLLTLVVLIAHVTLHAEDADEVREKGITALKDSQTNPRAIVDAARFFVKAAALYGEAGNEEKNVEMNSFLYWCKKKMTLADIDVFTKGGEDAVATKLAAVEKAAPKADDAQKWFERADQFAKQNPDEHLLIAIRFFEVASRFVGTKESIAAQERSLNEQTLASAAVVKTLAKPTPIKPTETVANPIEMRPVPGADDIKMAEKLIKDLLKADYAKTDAPSRLALVAKLLQQAEENKNDVASYYVLLHEARDQAVLAGDCAKAAEAQHQLRGSFKLDFATILLDLRKLEPSAKTAEPAAALALLFSLSADDALVVENYDQAVRFISHADDLLPFVKDAALKSRLKAEIPRVQAIKRESVAALAAQKTLATKPDDGEANLVAGKFALLLGDFEKSMAMLAKGKDVVLSGLAKHELAPPQVAVEQQLLADGWFDRAEKEATAILKTRMQDRAAHWYTSALPGLTGLAKLKVETKLKNLPGALKAEPVGTNSGSVVPKKVASNAPKISAIEQQALLLERKELLEKAKSETDRGKQSEMLIKAAQNALKLNDSESGIVELDKVVSEYGSMDYGNVSAKALIAKGKYFGSQENWSEAESTLASVWTEYRGSYGNSGCEAALILVTHYEKLGDVQKAMSFREKIIECGGSYGDSAAASCMWFAEYYIKHGDKVKALVFLNKIVEKYNGSYGNAKKAAEAKIKSLDK